jgi:hypothetical protein
MEISMSTKTKIAAVAVAALTLAGSMAVTSNQAQAKGGKGALIFGAIAVGTMLGAAAAASTYDDPSYDHRRCFWTTRYNDDDEPVRVRVCRYDD